MNLEREKLSFRFVLAGISRYLNRHHFAVGALLLAIVASPFFMRSATLSGKAAIFGQAVGQSPFIELIKQRSSRVRHTATVLADGRVLLAGGENEDGPVLECEIYDPENREFLPSGSLPDGRVDHASALVLDGRVLMSGGRVGDEPTSTTEFFNPAAGAIILGPPMVRARAGHSMTRLEYGRILVIGGDAEGTAEALTPDGGSFTLLPGRLSRPRSGHATALLADGRLLLVGGESVNGQILQTGEVLDLGTLQFLPLDSMMRAPRMGATVRVLFDAKVVIIGGDAEGSLEVFDPQQLRFTAWTTILRREQNLGSVLRSRGRNALFGSNPAQTGRLEQSFSGIEQDAADTLRAILDRSGASLTELPRQNRALLAGGGLSSGQSGMSAALLAGSGDAAVSTERTDYLPGEAVILAGTGWQPGETVDITCFDAEGEGRHTLRVTDADDRGNWKIQGPLAGNSGSPAGVMVMATGRSSGYAAQTAFAEVRLAPTSRSSADRYSARMATEQSSPGKPAVDLPLSVIPNEACPGFYIADVALAPGAKPGIWGVEVVLKEGKRELAGGLNLGGAVDANGQNAAWGAFNIANPTQESQEARIRLDAQALSTPGYSAGNLRLQVRILDVNKVPVDQGVSGPPPLQMTRILKPGFYSVEVTTLAGSPRATFQLAAETSFVGRTGGGFQGGAVVGGYLNLDSAGQSLHGFAAFCISDAQTVQFKTYNGSDYGAAGAGDLILTIYDSKHNAVWASTGTRLVLKLSGRTETPSNVILNLNVKTDTGRPITNLTQSSFTVVEDSRTVSALESNATAFPAPLSYDLYTVLMLDLSGSVTAQTLEVMIDSSKQFVRRLLPTNQKIAVYYFQSNVVLIQDFTSDEATLVATIDRLRGYVVPGASTNLYGAFIDGLTKLDGAPTGSNRLKTGALVVFTDGSDQAGKQTFAAAQSAVQRTTHSVFAVGLKTPELDTTVLQALGKTRFVQADSNAALVQLFQEVAVAIDDESRANYVFVYCSPKRAGSHTAGLTVRDSFGLTGQGSYDFSAGSFSDGCYSQVESLKLQYYDTDNDGYYGVEGPKHDCNDNDPYNWASCATCRDADGDGFRGTGCDRAQDCNDNNPTIHPGASDPPNDGIDQNCDGFDGGAGAAIIDPIIGTIHLVLPGTFTQGAPLTEFGRASDEGPQFQHALTKPIVVMETEVTRQMWADLKALQPTLPEDPSCTNPKSGMTDPVNCVTWYGAILFANLLSQQQGLAQAYYQNETLITPISSSNYQKGSVYAKWAAKGFRLPTEAEWEYFTRAGTVSPFSIDEPAYSLSTMWSCIAESLPALETVALFCANSFGNPLTVGRKAANPWGLKDVHGSVREWCWDWWSNSYPSTPQTDYRGPSDRDGLYRVLRGGSYNEQPLKARSGARYQYYPDRSNFDHGFRLVRSLN